MKRHILRKLQAWKDSDGRKPLILKGVRQCGKTYALTQFGRESFDRVFIVNFESNKSLKKIFQGDLDPHKIIQQLNFEWNDDIDIHSDLLILDEIQACPEAITSLKYFSERMPQLALCAAGSLLGLELTPTSFPVGKVDFLTLHPMNFTEFLMALGDQRSLKFLDKLTLSDVIPENIHEHIWKQWKNYLVVGGLPEVVKSFVEKKDNLIEAFNVARQKQLDLVNSYYADMAKHSGKENSMHIERVFESVPTQLARTQSSQAPRFQFINIIPGVDRYQRLVGVIDWLNKAGLILQVPILDQVEIPLSAYKKPSLFKLYCFDMGILGAMSQLPAKSILDYDFGTYKGYMAENFVASCLALYVNNDAYCWQSNRAEIEFIKQFDDAVIPLEVKAGHVVRAKSLEKYVSKYKPKLSVVLSGRSLELDQQANRLYLPLYLADRLGQFLP